MTEDERARHVESGILALCALVTLGCLVYPFYVIRPFRAQGPGELAAALGVLHFRNGTTAICAFLALATVLAYWQRQASRARRIAAVTAVVVTVVGAVLCRVNVYEQMFRPDEKPSFAAVQATKLDARESVLAVKSAGGAARAYPVRILAYHHIVNDVLDGTPIVATY